MGKAFNEKQTDVSRDIAEASESKVRDRLSCAIDYISFTILNKEYDFKTAIEEFGYDASEFYGCVRGGLGYLTVYKQNTGGVTVYCNGSETMGIHFDISGSGIGTFVEHFRNKYKDDMATRLLDVNATDDIFRYLFERISAIGKMTRLDLAIDNVDDLYYDVSELSEILKYKERYVSKFRSGYETKSFMDGGHTVYMGKRESDVMLRVYDKKMEQNNKHKNKDIDYPWVRWELEIKGKKAQKVCDYIAEGKNITELCFGTLSNYLRIIVPDNENKSRCTTDAKWEDFLQGVEKVSLSVPTVKKTLDEKMTWFSKQCAPTLAAFIFSEYGDMSYIYNNLDEWLLKANAELRNLIIEKMGFESAVVQYGQRFKNFDLVKAVDSAIAHQEEDIYDDDDDEICVEETSQEQIEWDDMSPWSEEEQLLTKKTNELLLLCKGNKKYVLRHLHSGKATAEERVAVIDEILLLDKNKREQWFRTIEEIEKKREEFQKRIQKKNKY